MRVIKLISAASTVCLAMAVSSVYAGADQKTINHAKAKTEVKSIKIKSKKTSSTNQSKAKIKPKNLKVVPKPVNLYKKLIGFGPDARIQINGFMSAGMAGTNVYNNSKYSIPGHGTIGKDAGFAANSLAGLQFTANITRKLAAVLQITATGEDINGEKAYHPIVDWAFIRYKINNALQFRIGRMRLPTFLYSQTEQVGITYIPVFLPPEVYRLLPFYNFNGVDLNYTRNLGNTGWYIRFNPFFGENKSGFDLHTNTPQYIPDETTATFHENYLMGGSVSVSNDYLTFHGAFARTSLTMDLPSMVLPSGIAVPEQDGVFKDKEATFYSAGAKLDYKNFVVATEFAHRSTPAPIASLSGAYGLVGYRVKKFLPYVMYARLWTTNTDALNKTPGSELPEAQRSVTFGTDYYFNKNVVGKIGLSRITPTDGTNGLFTEDPGKKHVWMYTAELDVAF